MKTGFVSFCFPWWGWGVLGARTQLSFLLAWLCVAWIWLFCLPHGAKMRGPVLEEEGGPMSCLPGWEGLWGVGGATVRWESVTPREQYGKDENGHAQLFLSQESVLRTNAQRYIVQGRISQCCVEHE